LHPAGDERHVLQLGTGGHSTVNDRKTRRHVAIGPAPGRVVLSQRWSPLKAEELHRARNRMSRRNARSSLRRTDYVMVAALAMILSIMTSYARAPNH
jgi:hypothetical protein